MNAPSKLDVWGGLPKLPSIKELEIWRASFCNFVGLMTVGSSTTMKHPLLSLILVLSLVGFAQVSHAPAAEPAPAVTIPESARSADLKSRAAGALSGDQIRQLIRAAADKDLENEKRQHDYTYIQREEEHKLDGKGQVKSRETRTSEVLMIYGEQVERLIAKNDKPLSEKDAAKQEEKIQKIIDKRNKESETDRKKRLDQEEKEREKGREFVKEVADAYNFHFVGVEQLDGRDTFVIDGDPRPGYQPHLKDARFLPKFRFRAWVDRQESQWKKLDVQCIDTVSWGLFLARIHKGTRIVIEQTRVNDEVWLPKHVALHVDARVVLLKGFNLDEDITYRDYKKFRADSKIVGVGELAAPQ